MVLQAIPESGCGTTMVQQVVAPVPLPMLTTRQYS